MTDDKSLKDSRHHRRFNVELMDIRGNVMAASGFIINDISLTGVSISSGEPLDTGGRYEVRISYDREDICLECTVVWCSETDAGEDSDKPPSGAYAAGLHFEAPHQDTVAMLVKFIESHTGKKTYEIPIRYASGYRANTRFRLADIYKDSSLNLFLPFKVKVLGLGGLLMQNKVHYNTGSELKMEMTLPENFLIQFTGTVVSCSPSKKSEAWEFETGIKFIDMSGLARDKLKEVIRRFYLKDAGFLTEGEGTDLPR